jgi:hypothetical protein
MKWRFWRRSDRPIPRHVDYVVGYCRCCGHPFSVERNGDIISVACFRQGGKHARPKCSYQAGCREYAGRCQGWHLSKPRYRWVTGRLLQRVKQEIKNSIKKYDDFVLCFDSNLLNDFAGYLADTLGHNNNWTLFWQDYGGKNFPHRWAGAVIAVARSEWGALTLLASALAGHVSPYDPYNLSTDTWERHAELDSEGRPRDPWTGWIPSVRWAQFKGLLGLPLDEIP